VPSLRRLPTMLVMAGEEVPLPILSRVLTRTGSHTLRAAIIAEAMSQQTSTVELVRFDECSPDGDGV
jgi:hypothetical protein